MSAAVIGLTLFAAALHATWNAALRSGVDRLCFVTIMSFATTLAAIPFALLLPLPATQSWTYLGISAVLQVLYSIFLAHAYRYGELGQVYPIVRGRPVPAPPSERRGAGKREWKNTTLKSNHNQNTLSLFFLI